MNKYIRIVFVLSLVVSIGVSACKPDAKIPDKKEVSSKVKAKKATPKPEVKPKPKPVAKKKLEPVVEKVSNKYFLIMASFQNVENADRLQKKLTNDGYISEIHNAPNGFHRVSYKGFSDRKRAFEELKYARSSEENKDNWLYIKR